MSSIVEIEVCGSPYVYEEYARFTTFVEQYAELSANDWRGGFLKQLRVQDREKAKQLEEYTELLADPSSLVFESFRSRLKESTQQGDIILFSRLSRDEDDVVLGVARTRLYRPRNPLKSGYAYAPDFLIRNSGATSSTKELLTRAHEITDSKKLVVDAFSQNLDHIEDLTAQGFKAKKIQNWSTPANLAHIIGNTYQVTQFEHKTA